MPGGLELSSEQTNPSGFPQRITEKNVTQHASALTPPVYCQYALGRCDQQMAGLASLEAFFIYPSQPPHLARTVYDCVRQLKEHSSEHSWMTWEDLLVGGQIVFCEICKAIRASKLVVANITTTNFNVLFELGYAVGLHKPVLPVRDATYETQKKSLDEIGIFDTLGFQQFSNSVDLLKFVRSRKAYSPAVDLKPEPNKRQPIYYLRAPVETDGSVKLLSSLKRSYFRFRTFDSRETPRLSLHEAYRQVLSSITVIAHLIDPERTGALVHNARSAFVCGMALAAGKRVLMLQEGSIGQPIDYRDIVLPYSDANSIPMHIENIIRATADSLQSIQLSAAPPPKGLLERIDLGDLAAENEIQTLSSYFVKTPQFQQVRQGHARLVIGRKGAGKTALFYGIRSQFNPRQGTLVVDLKPEGHQFTRLRETVLTNLAEGIQMHTLTAFWHYLLLLEIANKLLDREAKTAYRDPESLKRFEEFKALYDEQTQCEGDFSERLMSLVHRLVEHFPQKSNDGIKSPDITHAIYATDIRKLSQTVVERLCNTDGIWVLFDNIDKGFPTRGLHKEDILIVRCLLEATRKIQALLETRNIPVYTTIFIRRDVFDHLIDETPDRGKESYANLDWSDVELIKELLTKRIKYQAPELEGSFEDIWTQLFDPHIGGENSFTYILSRTFLRPRDILNFVRKSIQVAVSRGHLRVEPDDVQNAETDFSEDMLNELRYEIRDIFPDLPDLLMSFIGISRNLSREDIDLILLDSGVPEDHFENVREILLWFSFIGVRQEDEEYYSYQFLYNIPKLRSLIRDSQSKDNVYCIHPAFKSALVVDGRKR
jgi:hypothetical protein